MNKIKKGDTVVVTNGKDRGKVAKVLVVLPKEQQVVVEKVRVFKRHKKATSKQERSGIVEMAGKISWSNVKLVDPKTDKPTRISFETVKGKKYRKTKASGTLVGV